DLNDEKALLVWSWFSDAKHVENALLAVGDENKVLGLAHFHEYASPIAGNRGLMSDDVFVDPDARGQGTGTALVDAVRAYAADRGLKNVRWVSRDGEQQAADALFPGEPATSQWTVYELA